MGERWARVLSSSANDRLGRIGPEPRSGTTGLRGGCCVKGLGRDGGGVRRRRSRGRGIGVLRRPGGGSGGCGRD
jgi:hypothetical protein